MANPILNNKFLTGERVLEGEPMTINGAINKALIMLALVIISAAYTWSLVFAGFMDKAFMLGAIGMIAGFILALIISFTGTKTAPVLAPIYALCEGAFIGGISALFESHYSGIIIQAGAATFATAGAMLLLYKANIIKCTEKFRAIVFTATAAVAIVYLIQIIASFFNRGIPQIFTASPIGILFSVVIVGIAALNLIMDFDFIERGVANYMPKSYEWYGAFGLTVTLVWLYLEILKLLAKLRER